MKTESVLDDFMLPFQGLGNDNISKAVNSSFMDEDMVELYDKYYS